MSERLEKWLVERRTIEDALALDGVSGVDDGLDGYNATIFGLVFDGEVWQVYEDSLDEDEAYEWAAKATGYGEHVGLFIWDGGS